MAAHSATIMTNAEAKAVARRHLAEMLELSPAAAPLLYSPPGPMGEECYWFSFRFPNECWIGAGWLIGVRKSDGALTYFGADGGE